MLSYTTVDGCEKIGIPRAVSQKTAHHIPPGRCCGAVTTFAPVQCCPVHARVSNSRTTNRHQSNQWHPMASHPPTRTDAVAFSDDRNRENGEERKEIECMLQRS